MQASESEFDPRSALPLDPETRALSVPGDPITGVPCVLADGREWLLARLGNAEGLGDLRTELYDGMAYRTQVPVLAARKALWFALRHNYDVSPEEFARLAAESDAWRMDLAVDGVRPIEAICGALLPTEEDCEYGYEDWLRAALLSNGLDPAAVRPDDLPGVLKMLIESGRAVHPTAFVSAAIAGAEMRAARQLARAGKAAAAPSPPP